MLGHNAVVLLRELVQTSEAVAATSGRTAKITEIAALLSRADPGEVPVVVAFLSGELRQRQIGVGYASLGDLFRPGSSGPLSRPEEPPAPEARPGPPDAGPPDAGPGGAAPAGAGPLTVAETDAVFEVIGQ